MTRLTRLLWCPMLALGITLGGGSTFATQELLLRQPVTKVQTSVIHNGQLQRGKGNEQSLLKKMLSPKRNSWKVDGDLDGLADSETATVHLLTS